MKEDLSKERAEEAKQYQKMAAFHEGKAQELEARIADVKAIKDEARRHRREMTAALKKAEQLKGGKDEGTGPSKG